VNERGSGGPGRPHGAPLPDDSNPPSWPTKHVLELEATILWPGDEDIEGFKVVCTCGWDGYAFASTDIRAGLSALTEALEHERSPE
jgi:hypothetical protein